MDTLLAQPELVAAISGTVFFGLSGMRWRRARAPAGKLGLPLKKVRLPS